MIQAKCIQKFRDKTGKIYGYRLIDLNGQTQDVRPENLKQAIKAKQINIINLTLTSDNRLIDTNEKQLKNANLGKAPVQKQSHEDIFFEAVGKIVDKFCNNVGGDYTGYEENSDGQYIGQILGVYYPEEYKGSQDDYDKCYGVTFDITREKNKSSVWIAWQGNNGMATEDFSVEKELKIPLFSKDNLHIIKEAFYEFTDKVKKWIYNDKNNIEQENDWLKELHKDNKKDIEITKRFIAEIKAGTWELKHRTGKINPNELKEFAISRGYIATSIEDIAKQLNNIQKHIISEFGLEKYDGTRPYSNDGKLNEYEDTIKSNVYSIKASDFTDAKTLRELESTGETIYTVIAEFYDSDFCIMLEPAQDKDGKFIDGKFRLHFGSTNMDWWKAHTNMFKDMGIDSITDRILNNGCIVATYEEFMQIRKKKTKTEMIVQQMNNIAKHIVSEYGLEQYNGTYAYWNDGTKGMGEILVDKNIKLSSIDEDHIYMCIMDLGLGADDYLFLEPSSDNSNTFVLYFSTESMAKECSKFIDKCTGLREILQLTKIDYGFTGSYETFMKLKR